MITLLTWLTTALLVSFVFFSLMWYGKHQGYGKFMSFYRFNQPLHEFVRYAVAGNYSCYCFTLLSVDYSAFTWQWLLILLSGAAVTYIGEKSGTGWVSGAITRWDEHYWENDKTKGTDFDGWMTYPGIHQVILILPENMFGIFMVVVLRGLLWGIWFLPLAFIDPNYIKLFFAWLCALPAAHAMGIAFQHSLTPGHGSWGRQEEIRWPLMLIIATYL